MKAIQTNEQRIRALLKDLNTYETAILAERLICIAKMTKEHISTDHTPFNTFVTTADLFANVCDKVLKNLEPND